MKRIMVIMLLLVVTLSGCVSQADNDIAVKAALENKTDLASVSADLALEKEVNHDLSLDKMSLELEIGSLEANMEVLTAESESILAERDAMRADIEAVAEEHEVALADSVAMLEAVELELSVIEEIYPPGGFDTLMELNEWVRDNQQTPKTETVETGYHSALKVQSLGLKDGYLISVMYDEDDTDPDYGWIYNGAEVDGRLYVWDPELTEVYSWYTWLVR